MDWGVAVPAFVSVVGALSAIAAGLMARRKVRNEADSVVVGSAEQLVQTVMRQLDYMEREVARLQATIETYRIQVNEAVRNETMLRNEVESLRQRVGVLEGHILKSGLELP